MTEVCPHLVQDDAGFPMCVCDYQPHTIAVLHAEIGLCRQLIKELQDLTIDQQAELGRLKRRLGDL